MVTRTRLNITFYVHCPFRYCFPSSIISYFQLTHTSTSSHSFYIFFPFHYFFYPFSCELPPSSSSSTYVLLNHDARSETSIWLKYESIITFRKFIILFLLKVPSLLYISILYYISPPYIVCCIFLCLKRFLILFALIITDRSTKPAHNKPVPTRGPLVCFGAIGNNQRSGVHNCAFSVWNGWSECSERWVTHRVITKFSSHVVVFEWSRKLTQNGNT